MELLVIDIDDLFPVRSSALTVALEAAPRHPLEVHAHLNFRFPLAAEDRRYVQTTQARAERFARRFHSKLGFEAQTGQMRAPNASRAGSTRSSASMRKPARCAR